MCYLIVGVLIGWVAMYAQRLDIWTVVGGLFSILFGWKLLYYLDVVYCVFVCWLVGLSLLFSWWWIDW